MKSSSLECRCTTGISTSTRLLRSTQGGVSADYEYRLQSVAAGTQLTLAAQCSFRGLWKLLAPLISPLMARTDSGQPEALKAAMGG